MVRLSVFVYIDGFNLYRRCLKGTQYKWLDIDALCSMLLEDYDVTKIRYFTADISATPFDLSKALRQQIYLRALATNPKIEIHKGKFRTDPKMMPLHPYQFDAEGKPQMAKVKKTEEKGSDVNLASHLLLDGFRDRADLYVVLSNDSDLVEPLRILKHDLGKRTGIIFPTDRPSKELVRTEVDVIRIVREGVLASSQFEDFLLDGKGKITKPSAW